MHSGATNGNGHASDAGALPPLSLSILGVEPLDEFIREVADFIHYQISTRPQDLVGAVEVEAKIGILRDRDTGKRLQLPILTETILAPNAIDMRFEANMSAKQHQHYNELLNKLKTTPTSAHPSSTLAYQHLHLVDTFYAQDGGGRGDKVRVTRDEKTGTVLECVRKIRLADLNIYSPKRAADWRISVNLEVPVPPPLGTSTHSRKKDRMRYSHEEFVIDLTQVTSTAGGNAKTEVLHELELELARPEYLLSTAAKRGDANVSEHDRGAFDELIRAFVNNARILVRNADGGWQ
ncbi:mRNA capping enzyme [Trametes versicolor FP-101664 SS1]|uniref:mRNA-capping enzyme subunit beta n=1 Tax=Trametes versicolor (strain FP-101664) TaxID=717944 RepID=R7S6H0_TRAVS|nr:mRNA capping enzyme [Trametes versicolor FP-101664 SS1]EIW51553.1 mRNA capping enzyme [Trametes versicolor FP-101664 SS1]